MRGIRRAAMTIGVFVLGLLPVAAAVSPDAAPPDIPVALTQPVGHIATVLSTSTPRLPDSGLIILVGSGLLGLASIMRKSTRV